MANPRSVILTGLSLALMSAPTMGVCTGTAFAPSAPFSPSFGQTSCKRNAQLNTVKFTSFSHLSGNRCGDSCHRDAAGVTGLAALRATAEKDDLASSATEADAGMQSYQQSSGLVKGVVSGLTSLVNSVMAKELEETEETVQRDPLTPAELRDGIEGDYERMYLWTGDIDPDLYDASCVFTDPTLSFKGLKTFQKNLANLRPIIDRVVREYDVELYQCELDEKTRSVEARWRMVGTLDLPWAPLIDLRGSTKFRYEESAGNRIVDYFETWETPAGTVLLNLLKPGAR